MKAKPIFAGIVLVTFLLIACSNMASAKSDNEIIFKDKNLQSELSRMYDCEVFTKDGVRNLNKEDRMLVLRSAGISDLEGLQYFDNLSTIYLDNNDLINLKPLSSITVLGMLSIKNNSIKGQKFENSLNAMGKNESLSTLILSDNGLNRINFLNKIGHFQNYSWIDMENNKISDISILKKASNLETLDLSNNRITDVTPLKDLENLTYYLDLRDNCIIDYKPIKPLLDAMHADEGNETGLERYDYYTNPVNFTYNGKTIKFPYLTEYYKYQAYAEAIPLFKAFGGSAKYNKKTGTLTCNYNGKVLVMKDFSKNATLNGKKITLDYPMRRMQYDLAYIPVKDVCEVLGLNYEVVKTRKIWHDYKYMEYAPKTVEISNDQKELG